MTTLSLFMRKIPRVVWFCFAIIAIICAIPSWRNIARVQVQGSPLMRYSFLPHSRLPDDYWAHAALKRPHDLNLWVMAAEEYPFDESDIYRVRFPGDADKTLPAAASIAFPGQLAGSRNRELCRRYDTLIQRFKNDARLSLLLVRRLRFTIAWLSPNRLAGELNDYEWKRGNPRPAREHSGKPANFTATEINTAIALCRRGQQLAPQNAFFDWTLCQLLLVSRRDEEAWKALHSGAAKSEWSEYLPEYWQSTLAAHQSVWRWPLLWEEKGRALYLRNDKYPFDWQSEAIVEWEMIQDLRRGDHAKALQIAGSLMQLGKVRRRENALFSNALNTSLERIAWSAFSHDTLASKPGAPRTSRRKRNQLFQEYALQQNRLDLAQLADSTWHEYRALTKGANSKYFYNLTLEELAALALWWRAGVWLLTLLCGATLTLIITGVLARYWSRLRNALQLYVTYPTPTQRDVISGVLGCLGASVLLRAMRLAGIAALWLTGVYLLTLPFPSAHSTFLRQMDDATIGLRETDFTPSSWISGNWLYQDYTDPVTDIGLQLFIVGAVLFLGFLHAMWRAAAWQKALVTEEANRFQFRQLLKTLYNGSFWRFNPHFDWRDAARILDEQLLHLTLIDDWARRPQRRAAARFGFRLWCASLWGVIAIMSTLFLVTLLASTPLRIKADRNLERIIKFGEVRAAQMDRSR